MNFDKESTDLDLKCVVPRLINTDSGEEIVSCLFEILLNSNMYLHPLLSMEVYVAEFLNPPALSSVVQKVSLVFGDNIIIIQAIL